jgi:hypothetical protein
LLLLGQGVRDGLAIAHPWVIPGAVDGIGPRPWFRGVACEELPHLVEGVGVVHRQFPETRIRADVDGLANHAGMSRIGL